MPALSAKGFMFNQIVQQIFRRWGREGVEKISSAKSYYIDLKWYSFEEFCEILKDVGKEYDSEEKPIFEKMGHDLVVDDIRWQSIFRDKDPKEIFPSTKRQDTEYICGDVKAVKCADNSVKITTDVEIEDSEAAKFWFRFYEGRLKGVLDLTGHEGEVEREQTKDFECKYKIEWK